MRGNQNSAGYWDYVFSADNSPSDSHVSEINEMIIGITGRPGNGKSLYAVQYILKTFCGSEIKINTEDNKPCMILDDGYHLVHNIDGLRCFAGKDSTVYDLDAKIREYDGIDKLLQKIKDVKKVILVIDEAQSFFPAKFYSPEIFLYFEKHRHYDHHLVMITQNINRMPRQITGLWDLEYRVASPKFSQNKLVAVVYSGDIIVDRINLSHAKKIEIYDLYKSAIAYSFYKPKKKKSESFYFYPLIGLIVFLLGFSYTIWLFIKPYMTKDTKTTKKPSVSIVETESKQTPTENQHQNQKRVIGGTDWQEKKKAEKESKIISGKSKNDLYSDDSYSFVSISSYRLNDKLFLISPIDNCIYPANLFPFETIKFGASGYFAKIDKHLYIHNPKNSRVGLRLSRRVSDTEKREYEE